MTTHTYEPLVSRDQYTHWAPRNQPSFVPTARQQVLMDTYIAAKDAGNFYTKDVLSFAIKHLNVPADIASVGADKVEGGDLGMDIYYARDAVYCIAARARSVAAASQLNATVGMALGSLSINYKRTNCCTVTAVEGSLITFTAKRGGKSVEGKAGAEQIISAAIDALRRGWRKAALV